MALAVTIQLARSCLLDLFAQGLRRSALADRWRICARLTPRLAQKSASQPLPSQLNGYGWFYRWLLMLLALLLGGGQLLAASREDRAYTTALLAFQNKFYSVATNRLTQYLQTYHDSTNAPAALLLLAQSEFYLTNYVDVTNRLADPVNLARAKTARLADQYDYWQAEAQFALGDFPEAAQTFVSVADNYPDSPLALSAVVEAATAFRQNSNWPQVDRLLDNTNGLFQRTAQRDPANRQVANGRLLLAESKCVQRDFGGAGRILSLLNPAFLTVEQNWNRVHLLYRAALGRNDLGAALAAATNLVQIARTGQGDSWPANLAESVACNASVLEQQGRLSEACDVWQENLATNVPVAQQQRAILKLAGLSVAQNNLADAETRLANFLAQFPDSPAAETALMTLGELHLKDFIANQSATNHLTAAQSNLDQFITIYTNSPLLGKALLDRGWCSWLAGDYPGSFASFQAAAQRLPVSEDLAVARFKMGDAQFAVTNLAGAETNYHAVLTDFPGLTNVANSLGESALYQILRAQLESRTASGLEDTMKEFLGRFSTAIPAETNLLLAGQGFSSFGMPAKAREVFQRFEKERTNSPLIPEVAFAMARTYERDVPPNWLAVVTNCEAWLHTYTDEPLLRPQVEYVRDWAVAQNGDEAEGFELFTNFVSNYTNDPQLTPLAYWWMADHYFRSGTNFDKAEFYYQMIFQNFPTNELANRARLMAGRAALGRSGYSDAGRYFLGVLTDGPGYLKDQALFGYCEVLRMTAPFETNYASLQQATNYLSQMYGEAATNIAGALAWCETGDCDLQMGALDAATNAYAQAMNSPVASEELVCRAKVGLGIALEKKAEGLPDDDRKVLDTQALGQYLDVISIKSSEWWIKKAGLQALQLVSTAGIGNADQVNLLYGRLEELLPQLKDTLEKKRAAFKTDAKN